jgi:ribonuclease HII
MARLIVKAALEEEATLQRFLFDRKALRDWPEAKILWGMDEVGRGSLMGPVVAACVAFVNLAHLKKRDLGLLAESLHPLNDSKKLKPAVREALSLKLQSHDNTLLCPVYWGIGEAAVAEIETLNILKASQVACWRAYEQARVRFPQLKAVAMRHQALLVDGNKPLPQWLEEAPQRCIVKGDGLSASIAAASVIAKQWRDGWVQTQAKQVDAAYGWQSNMGYATAQHRKAIQTLGATPWHRPLFLRKLLATATQGSSVSVS